MTRLKLTVAPLLALTLLLPLSGRAEPEVPPAPAPAPQVQTLIMELLSNVDWQLMLRLHENLMRNLDLIGPYSEEYLACLEAEGSLKPGETLDLQRLLELARNTGSNCQVILQSLAGQLDFDISQQELEQGLSPEYREMLKKSL